MTPIASTVRVLADITRTAGLTNALTSGEITLWRSSATVFQIALSFAGTLFDDISSIASLTLEIKATATNGGAPAPETAPEAALTLSAAELTNTTPALWQAGQGQHATFEFSSEQLNIPAGRHWLVISASTFAARTFTATAGLITIKEDGYNDAGIAPTPDTTAWTKDEADARYGDNLAYAARLSAGNLTLVNLANGQLTPLIATDGKLNPAFLKVLTTADVAGLLDGAGKIPFALLPVMAPVNIAGLLGDDGHIANNLMPAMSTGATPATLALRTAQGRVRTADPEADTDAVNLRTLNAMLATYGGGGGGNSGGGGGDDDDNGGGSNPSDPTDPTEPGDEEDIEIPLSFTTIQSNLYLLCKDTTAALPGGYTRAATIFKFGDAFVKTLNNSSQAAHLYSVPGTFNVTLEIRVTYPSGKIHRHYLTKALTLAITEEETNTCPPVDNLRLVNDSPGFDTADFLWDQPDDLELFANYYLDGAGSRRTVPKQFTNSSVSNLLPYTTYTFNIRTARPGLNHELFGPASTPLKFTTGIGLGEYTIPEPVCITPETGYNFPTPPNMAPVTINGDTYTARYDWEGATRACYIRKNGVVIWTAPSEGYQKAVFIVERGGKIYAGFGNYGAGTSIIVLFRPANSSVTTYDFPDASPFTAKLGTDILLLFWQDHFTFVNASTESAPMASGAPNLGGSVPYYSIAPIGDSVIFQAGSAFIFATQQNQTVSISYRSWISLPTGISGSTAIGYRVTADGAAWFIFSHGLMRIPAGYYTAQFLTGQDFDADAGIYTNSGTPARTFATTRTAVIQVNTDGAPLSAVELFRRIGGESVLRSNNAWMVALVTQRTDGDRFVLHLDLYDLSTNRHVYARSVPSFSLGWLANATQVAGQGAGWHIGTVTGGESKGVLLLIPSSLEGQGLEVV